MKDFLIAICFIELIFMTKYKMDSIHYRDDAKMYQKGLDTALDLNEEKRGKLEQCEDANYTLTQKEEYSRGLATEAIDAAQMLSKRLKLTTDIAEVEIECNDKKEINCLTEPKVRTYLQENRKAKF